MAAQPGRIGRRTFIKAGVVAGGLAGAGLPAADRQEASAAGSSAGCRPCLFTKPLGARKAEELPAVLAQLQVDSVDLTCRPGGHVLPERAADDLPRTVERLRAAGIAVPMVTTGILDAGRDHAETIVRAAAALGIRFIKPGYYEYADVRKVLPILAETKARFRDVAALCAAHGVHAAYHLHSGARVGAVQWDLWQLLEGLPESSAGCYYDARHATVEGGLAGWEIGLNLLIPRISVIAVKDFVWHKADDGKWVARDVPLGTGMVRHAQVLKRLREVRFAGPVSLHCEYCSIAVQPGSDDERRNFDDIRRDWRTLKDLLARADLA
jgi:sugar phosphate isomerase/epimerase